MAEKNPEQKLAVIMLRGEVGLSDRIKRTLRQLRLSRKNHCVVVPNKAENLNMIRKINDYITWGEINDETFNELADKRGELYNGIEEDKKKRISYSHRYFTFNNKKIKKVFRLNSPVKGFGKKGLKASFKNGGALGYRGDKINELIKRMI